MKRANARVTGDKNAQKIFFPHIIVKISSIYIKPKYLPHHWPG